MFCPKCGIELEDGSYKCTACEWTWEDVEKETDNEITQSDTQDESLDINEDVNKSKAVSDAKIIIDNKFAVANNYIKNNPKRFKIIVATVAIIIISIIIAMVVHFNSDSYKIKKASELIAEGKYSEGVDKIYDIYSPQAMVLKNFVEVENQKQLFVDAVIAQDHEESYEFYYDFKDALNTFDEDNEVYYLPENLRKKYDCYRTAFDYIAEYSEISEDHSNEMVTALSDIQNVMMNEVDRNNSSKGGSVYTLNTLQSRVNTSTEAIKVLEKYDFSCIKVNDSDVIMYCHTSENEGDNVIYTCNFLSDTMDDLIKECQSEISSSQININNSKEDFDMDDELYKVSTIENYSSYVGVNLEKINDYGDISKNRETILKVLRKDMLYFLITGNTAAQYSDY